MVAFSVLMAVYPGENPRYLVESLNSLLMQKDKASEVILVEDGLLSDNLINIIEEFRRALNIVSVKIAENRGLGYALNLGLRFCSYDLVARMDSDDIACSDRFFLQLDFMKSNPDISVLGGVVEEFNDSDFVFSKRLLPLKHNEIIKFAKLRNPLSHPSVIFRKNAVLLVGGYPDLRRGQDYALWSKLIVSGFKLANLSDILIKMRMGKFISKKISCFGVRGILKPKKAKIKAN